MNRLMEDVVVASGNIVMLSDGDYSDYIVRDHLTATRDINFTRELISFLRAHDKRVLAGNPEPFWDWTMIQHGEKFIAELIANGSLLPMAPDTVVEVHESSIMENAIELIRKGE